MLFSVIIPAYKMGRYIGEALESVVSQTYPNWEIIVVDDCAPEDGTAEIVLSFAAKHPDKRIEFIRHEVNTGVSGARNTALRAATGEYAAFLDPDDLWLPDYLAVVANTFASDPDTDVVATPPIGLWEIPGKTIPPDIIRFEKWQISEFPASLAISNFIQPSSTVARMTSVREIGGFVTDREMQHIEDYDLWIRLVQAGAKFTFINENMTKYRKHPSAATSNNHRMEKLHERLAERHAAFFINHQRVLLRNAILDIQKIRNGLKRPIYTLMTKVLRRQ